MCHPRLPLLHGALVAALLCFAVRAWAGWSPEIVLHVSPQDVPEGTMETSIAVDADENVHVLYGYHHMLSGVPYRIFEGLIYCKFDAHGNALCPPMILNDSLDQAVSGQTVLFFGRDSLWVCFERLYRTPDNLDRRGLAQCTIDFNGSLIGPMSELPGTVDFIQYPPVFATDSSRRVVTAYIDTQTGNEDRFRCTVRNPDGTLVMNHALIWHSHWYAQYPCGFVDATDSLQVIWNQQRYIWGEGESVYAKRVCITHDFDTAHEADSSIISPFVDGESWGSHGFLQPADDSLVSIAMDGPGDSNNLELSAVRVVRRSDYSLVAQAPVGGKFGDAYSICREPDGTISLFYRAHLDRPDGPFGLRFKRFTYPALTVVEDSLFLPEPVNISLNTKAYAVAPGGTRHLVYKKIPDSSAPSLVYRFWRRDLGSPQPRSSHLPPQFVLSPNPVTENLTIEGPLSSVKTIVLYNLLGQEVLRLSPQGGGQRVVFPEVAKLPSGIYFLHLQTRNGASVQKIVVGR